MFDKKHRHIIIAASRDCFVNCKGCYNFFGKKRDIVTTKDLISFFKKIDTKKVKKVTISGGDPLARPDIVDFIKNVKKIGFDINLDTVGTRFIKDIKSLKESKELEKINVNDISSYIKMIGIPLDGSNDEIIKLFRSSSRDLFKEKIKILDSLNNNSAKICINTVVHKNNKNDLKNIYRIISKYKNISDWQLFQFMPIGPLGYINRKLYEISDEDYDESIKNLKGFVGNDCNIKITPKSKKSRKKLYLLIDTDGFVWTPFSSLNNNFWEDEIDKNDKRIIFGNILDEKSYEKIFNFLYKGEV